MASYPNSSINGSGVNGTSILSIPPAAPDITEEQEMYLKRLSFWVYAVLTNIVIVLGLIGNMLTILILTQRAMRSSTNFYLCALAVWDSILLICTILLLSLNSIPNFESYGLYVYSYVVSYIYPIGLTAQTATIWLTVSFTVERYIAVCHPLKAASMCTLTRAKIVIIGVAFGSLLYNIPRWFDYRPKELLSSENVTSRIIFTRTLFSQNPLYMEVYYSWLYVPIMCIIPLLVLSVLNTFLVLAVRNSQRQRLDMNVRQSRENNVTIMLVTVVIVFIICQVPALAYNLAWAINDTYTEHNFSYMVLSVVRNFLVNLNSAVNFILYCALGQKFRRIFLHTFCRRCINESYIPMSGVHHPTIAGAGSNRGGRPYNPNGPGHGKTAIANIAQNKLSPNSYNLKGSTKGHHPGCVVSRETCYTSKCDCSGHSPGYGKGSRFTECETRTYTALPTSDKRGRRQRDAADLGLEQDIISEHGRNNYPMYKLTNTANGNRI